MAKSFDLDTLTQGLNNRVIIAGNNLSEARGNILNAPGVTGIMLNDLSISGSNDFGTLFNSGAVSDRISQTVGKTATSLAAAFSSDELGQFVQDFAPRNLTHTVAHWAGSSKPPFSLNLLFLRVRERDNIMQKVLSLYRGVLPEKAINVDTGIGRVALSTIRAPLGYFATSENTAVGTMSLQLGQWFRASNLIMRSCDFTFSKEISTDGNPLFAIGSVVFEPFRMITYDEFASYFVNTSVASNPAVGNPGEL